MGNRKRKSVRHTRRHQKQPAKKYFELRCIEEPELLFGNEQLDTDPKGGIFSFGPYSVGEPSRHPSSIRIGIVGSGETIGLTENWLKRVEREIEPIVRVKHRVVAFPGFSSDYGPFRSSFIADSACIRQLTNLEIDKVTSILDRRRGFEEGLELILKPVQIIAENYRPDVIILALPQSIYDACKAVGGPKDRPTKTDLTPSERALLRLAKKDKKKGQKLLFDDLYNLDDGGKLAYRNFRRALKARVMKWGVPIQIMLPRSFFDETSCNSIDDKLIALKRRSIQEPSTRAWNFCSAMYFKANGVPWRLAGIQPGTCFVGVSFFRHDTLKNPHLHTSLGQVFTDQGDALVVRGDRFEWDVESQGRPHLSRFHSKKLIEEVVEMYKDHVNNPPKRLVVHKSSRFAEDEKNGFIDGVCSANVGQYDLVTIYSRGIRLFREGIYPPVRGTVVQIPDGGDLLYTMGYIPLLDTYPKGHVPKPIEIVERFGDSNLNTVCKEILGLTKLNWNSADYASAEPITLRFSREVGKVLTELPDEEKPHPHYRFYV